MDVRAHFVFAGRTRHILYEFCKQVFQDSFEACDWLNVGNPPLYYMAFAFVLNKL